MEESQINTESSGAKERLKEDTNFNSEENDLVFKSIQSGQIIFQKNSSLTMPEDLQRDRSEKALSRVQPSLFIHAGDPTITSENLSLTKEATINGPVSCSPTITSIISTDSISKTLEQSAVQQKDLCSSLKVVYDLQQPTIKTAQISSQQVLFLIPDIAHTKKDTHSIVKLPTSSICSDTTNGNIFTLDSTLIEPVDVCDDRKNMPVKEVYNPHGCGKDDYVTGNETNMNGQKELVNNENAAGESEKNCVVKVEKKRKRKMDGSKITRCYSEDAYNDDYISKKKLLNLDMMEQSDEEQLLAPHNFELTKVKSESNLDDTEEHLPNEAIDAMTHYMCSPVCDFSDEASPDDVGSFFPNNDCDSLSPPTCTNDQEPSFYPCTKCNVNFREKKHLHRHMMYHLDGNNHFRHLNVPRPYACRECGRTFRDRNSLLKHMIIHQERRQKLMEEIRELKELQDEGRSARLQCPQCVFGTNCPKTFVQHAKTHEKDKRYYCCEECNFMAVSENELECHRSAAHGAVVKCPSLTSDIPQRKAIEKSESPSEHTCALCGGWFDTKIGLSNHVRGHLKRIGKTKWDANKSPICVLNEMLQNEEKYEQILKALSNRRPVHKPFIAQKPSSNNSASTALPLEARHNGLKLGATSDVEGLPLSNECNKANIDADKDQPFSLIELLKMKRLGQGKNVEHSAQKISQTARKRFIQKCLHPLNEDCSSMCNQHKSMDYAMHAEFKQKKSRSRSGSKKKGLAMSHGADEVYILRCRFCGLVFRGPLSIQEDWIKHLQRHIVNANLPRTGAGMVEVESLLKKPPSISEPSFPILMEATS
ncbi:hypothetical protein XENTR_v10012194 [Xenopus tropicalis]|nr:hypothetical protein XENTR_v10012194 [Xenopus tropicalis]KAE8610650.1 hypothetical protein XENTR_v10012194 [Xenopus tropicalis]